MNAYCCICGADLIGPECPHSVMDRDEYLKSKEAWVREIVRQELIAAGVFYQPKSESTYEPR